MADEKQSGKQIDFWPDFRSFATYPVQRKKIFGAAPKLFTIGSCFAIEIRKAFQARGLTVYPDYTSIQFDPATQILDKLPRQRALMHYDTFSMLQEFECAFDLWTDRAASFIEVRNVEANSLLGSDLIFKDPTRRMIYGKTREALADVSTKVDQTFRAGLDAADVLVLTLGLTEVWRHTVTGRYFGAQPEFGFGGGIGKATFHQSSYPENYANLRMMVELLRTNYPAKPIVISVSPIHLESTFSDLDVGTATTESKAILRAVAGQVCRDFASRNVHYFPAYEMAQFSHEPVWAPDGRHVRPEFAASVVAAFFEAFGDEAVAP